METVLYRRRWVVVGVALLVCVLCAGRVLAQADSTLFENRARLLKVIDSDPGRVVATLEAILTAEQAAALETALSAAPDDRDKAASLEAARQRLLEAGLDASDALVRGIDMRLTALRPSEAPLK